MVRQVKHKIAMPVVLLCALAHGGTLRADDDVELTLDENEEPASEEAADPEEQDDEPVRWVLSGSGKTVVNWPVVLTDGTKVITFTNSANSRKKWETRDRRDVPRGRVRHEALG